MLRLTFLILLIFLYACNQNNQNRNQKESIRLNEYIYPTSDTMKFNCVYNSFHANGLHDTVILSFKKIDIENTTAYCISSVSDSDCRYSQLASFLGSAMIFRNDSILLAPLQWDKPADSIRLKDFLYCIPPNINLTDTVLIKLQDRNIILSNFEYATIEDHILEICLKIKITEEYKDVKEPYYGYVWMTKRFGIVKWVRVTGRTELRDLSQNNSPPSRATDSK